MIFHSHKDCKRERERERERERCVMDEKHSASQKPQTWRKSSSSVYTVVSLDVVTRGMRRVRKYASLYVYMYVDTHTHTHLQQQVFLTE